MNTLRPKRQAFAKCCERIAKHYEDYESDWSSDEQSEYEMDTGGESFIATSEEGKLVPGVTLAQMARKVMLVLLSSDQSLNFVRIDSLAEEAKDALRALLPE